MEQESGAAMFSADFKERAFPIYAAMREQGPVASVTLPTGEPIWFVIRYAEVVAMLKDNERFANDPSNTQSIRLITPVCAVSWRSRSRRNSSRGFGHAFR